ncbi:MAG TPA: hypothetical protein VML75_17315 [Kofleriaceae bacterium]|nr:hypothetical protein [Kofleriaceae bacterium]
MQWEPGALAILGAALVTAHLFALVVGGINGPAFTAALRKLLDANNRDRAIKLTNAAPRAHLALIWRAGLEASLERRADEGESLVREVLRESVEGALAKERRRVRRAALLSLAGAVAAAVAASIAYSGQATPPGAVTGFILAAGAGALLGWHRTNRLLAGLKSSAAQLVEDLTAYVMRGGA